ncbi:hypothetical protein [Rhodopirellula islandica]|uniref:hypothetical protein n=1 Tax=Rhodopirellula islandica TaxID=595434 RepID=UPI0009FA9B94|nr:hypothetical protein [Rhodopirellula islandica]
MAPSRCFGTKRGVQPPPQASVGIRGASPGYDEIGLWPRAKRPALLTQRARTLLREQHSATEGHGTSILLARLFLVPRLCLGTQCTAGSAC